jgi:hypothetical protein
MKRISFSVTVTVLLALVWALGASGQTQAVSKLKLAASTDMATSFGDTAMGRWTGGALLIVNDRFSVAPTFRSFDANGRQLSEFELTIPDAALIKVFAFARGLDGSIAAGGTAVTVDSRGTTFLALISPDGQKQTILRTYPLFAQAVTVASDGTVWVASQEDVEPGNHANHEHALLRRYDSTGKLLGSFFPWSSLPTEPKVGPPSRRSTLVASKDRIGWYVPLAHVYIELAPDGTVINRFDTHPIESRRGIASFALCDDGGAFIGASEFNVTQRTAWGVFALDREHSSWNFFPRDTHGGIILGCDGTRLASTIDGRIISWLEPGE